MEVIKHNRHWTVKVNTDTRKVQIYFHDESIATILIGDDTYKDISKDTTSLEKYALKIVDRALNGDFSL